MAIQTTTLSIISKDSSTGDDDCIVVPQSPLFIQELLLSPIDNLGAPSGHLPPGQSPNGSLRTLCLDSTHEAFSTSAPYSLSVTYDTSNNYSVSEAHVVHSMQPAIELFGAVSSALPALLPEQQSFFLAQVLTLVLPALAQARTFAAGAALAATGKSKSHGSENGKEAQIALR
jgi:hypothetical protein